MEAMRLVDEFPIVRQRLPDPDIQYQTRTKKLKWEDKATLAVAKVVLAKLKKPRTIPELVDEVQMVLGGIVFIVSFPISCATYLISL